MYDLQALELYGGEGGDSNHGRLNRICKLQILHCWGCQTCHGNRGALPGIARWEQWSRRPYAGVLVGRCSQFVIDRRESADEFRLSDVSADRAVASMISWRKEWQFVAFDTGEASARRGSVFVFRPQVVPAPVRNTRKARSCAAISTASKARCRMELTATFCSGGKTYQSLTEHAL